MITIEYTLPKKFESLKEKISKAIIEGGYQSNVLIDNDSYFHIPISMAVDENNENLEESNNTLWLELEIESFIYEKLDSIVEEFERVKQF